MEYTDCAQVQVKLNADDIAGHEGEHELDIDYREKAREQT